MLLKDICRRDVLNYCISKNMIEFPHVNITDVMNLYEYFTIMHLKCTGYNYVVSSDITTIAQRFSRKFRDNTEFRTEVLLSYFWSEVKYICWLREKKKMNKLIDMYTSMILVYI